MCVIISRPVEHTLTLETLERCSKANRDGWGIMYAEGGIVHVVRGMHWHQFKTAYAEMDNRHVILHFRWKTHGAIDLANTHPYVVLNMEDHGQDLWVMHNGTISIKQDNLTMSDTWHWVRDFVRPLLIGNPGALDNEFILRALSASVSGSRIVFLDGAGMMTFLNHESWTKANGCRWSNNYHIDSPKVTQYVGGYRPGIYSGSYDASGRYDANGYYTPPGGGAAATFPKKVDAPTSTVIGFVGKNANQEAATVGESSTESGAVEIQGEVPDLAVEIEKLTGWKKDAVWSQEFKCWTIQREVVADPLPDPRQDLTQPPSGKLPKASEMTHAEFVGVLSAKEADEADEAEREAEWLAMQQEYAAEQDTQDDKDDIQAEIDKIIGQNDTTPLAVVSKPRPSNRRGSWLRGDSDMEDDAKIDAIQNRGIVELSDLLGLPKAAIKRLCRNEPVMIADFIIDLLNFY